jgi:hypothetical protein
MTDKDKQRKPLADKPTEKVIRKLFPKKVVEKAKEIAHEHDEE